MLTIKITQKGELKKEFTDQSGDIVALGWLLRNQSNSTDWAIRHEGWAVEVIDQDTNKSTFWETYDKKAFQGKSYRQKVWNTKE